MFSRPLVHVRCSSHPSASMMKAAMSNLTYSMKPLPSKAQLHKPIPSSAFPRGFILGGIHAGVKKKRGVLDLALAVSTTAQPAAAAGVFTRNAVAAAPVTVSAHVLEQRSGRVRAVVTNSGCANAVTGRRGLEDAWKMAHAADSLVAGLGFGGNKNTGGSQEHSESLVMSTGVIGQHLPIDAILRGIDSFGTHRPATSVGNSHDESASLGATFAHWERAAIAFMTTDTFPKLRARTFRAGAHEYRLAGMTKGAGMIHPDMGALKPGGNSGRQLHATLLSLILTDVPIAPAALQRALGYAVDRSFNSISVDGDMSTNDTVLVLANGAGAPPSATEVIDEECNPEAFSQFQDALTEFAAELAQLVVRDGEGATKFITVTGAATYADAHAVASRISTSALVKTALYGEDANWGRVLAATGSLCPPTLSTPLDASRISVSFVPVPDSSLAGSSAPEPPLPLLIAGEPSPGGIDEERAKQILSRPDLEILVDLGLGNESARYWTCDFSYEYVKINGDYRS